MGENRGREQVFSERSKGSMLRDDGWNAAVHDRTEQAAWDVWKTINIWVIRWRKRTSASLQSIMGFLCRSKVNICNGVLTAATIQLFMCNQKFCLFYLQNGWARSAYKTVWQPSSSDSTVRNRVLQNRAHTPSVSPKWVWDRKHGFHTCSSGHQVLITKGYKRVSHISSAYKIPWQLNSTYKTIYHQRSPYKTVWQPGSSYNAV